MTTTGPRHIFFVDDEEKVLQAVHSTLAQSGAKVSCFKSAAECLGGLRLQNCDLLITDVKMPVMDGIELIGQAKRVKPHLPVIAVTGYGDIPMAVRALRAGARDFIEKPLERHNFLTAVDSILKEDSAPDVLEGRPLTEAEMKVLRLILEGHSNKEIAALLHRSVRTIEDHRGHIMRKVGADNIVDLVKRSYHLGLLDL
jgi:FixJ family two-component response regulator